MSTTTQTQTGDAQTQNDDLVARVAEAVNVPTLRSWMSINGLARSRGADKEESIELAIEQDEALVEALAAGAGGRFVVTAGRVELGFNGAEDAVEFAKAFKSANHTSFPRAVDTETGERLYG